MYIAKVMLNQDAMLVKREDLADNMDITRFKQVKDSDLYRVAKYKEAFKLIDTALRIV